MDFSWWLFSKLKLVTRQLFVRLKTLLKSGFYQKTISKKLSLQTSWTETEIKSLVNETAEFTGVNGKDLYSPLRLSLFGSPHGPDISLLVDILGVHESTNRLKQHI